MIAIGFVYVVFMSHLSYIVLEQKEEAYKDKTFWLIIIGLLAAVYLTLQLLQIA